MGEPDCSWSSEGRFAVCRRKLSESLPGAAAQPPPAALSMTSAGLHRKRGMTQTADGEPNPLVEPADHVRAVRYAAVQCARECLEVVQRLVQWQILRRLTPYGCSRSEIRELAGLAWRIEGRRIGIGPVCKPVRLCPGGYSRRGWFLNGA